MDESDSESIVSRTCVGSMPPCKSTLAAPEDGDVPGRRSGSEAGVEHDDNKDCRKYFSLAGFERAHAGDVAPQMDPSLGQGARIAV